MHTLTLSGRQHKDQRINDRIGDQRSNSTVEQHHLTNGHDSLNMLKVGNLMHLTFSESTVFKKCSQKWKF